MGQAAHELKPVHDALLAHLKGSSKLFMDETPAPVLPDQCSHSHRQWAYAERHQAAPTMELQRLKQRDLSPKFPPSRGESVTTKQCVLIDHIVGSNEGRGGADGARAKPNTLGFDFWLNGRISWQKCIMKEITRLKRIFKF